MNLSEYKYFGIESLDNATGSECVTRKVICDDIQVIIPYFQAKMRAQNETFSCSYTVISEPHKAHFCPYQLAGFILPASLSHK